MKKTFSLSMAAICAGTVTGILGAGGGMILAPLLSLIADEQHSAFSTSLLLMIPICAISLVIRLHAAPVPWPQAFIYLIGSGLGGIGAGFLGPRIPQKWLHRIFGMLVLWGGIRYLWS